MQKYQGSEYELKVSRVKMEDKGEYTVRAENSFGRKDERARLTVEGEHKFLWLAVSTAGSFRFSGVIK